MNATIDSDTREKGRHGEDEACEHLISIGYTIISRNYQSRHGEIDCIAKDQDGTIVFIEVKSAFSKKFGNPFAKVNHAKQQKIIGMARLYLAEHKLSSACSRFDVIAVTPEKIEHLKNAFISM